LASRRQPSAERGSSSLLHPLAYERDVQAQGVEQMSEGDWHMAAAVSATATVIAINR
jgi:hypothetical protein